MPSGRIYLDATVKTYEVCDYSCNSHIGLVRMREALKHELDGDCQVAYFVERKHPDSDSLPVVESRMDFVLWLIQ